MNTPIPSLFVCFLLVPSAYYYSGGLTSFRTGLMRGRTFFQEVITSRKKIGRICSQFPRYQAVPTLFLFFTASYIFKHGGIWGGIVNAAVKLRSIGIKGILFASAANIHNLRVSGVNPHQRILLFFCKNMKPSRLMLSFLHILKINKYEIEVFTEQNTFFVKNFCRLRHLGVRRVVASSARANILDYLYDIGDSYSVYLLPPAGLHHVVLDCIRYNSPRAKIICVCEDSEEVRPLDTDLLGKIDYLIAGQVSFKPVGLSIITPPNLSGNSSHIEQDDVIAFLQKCELLSPSVLAQYFTQKPFPAAIPGDPALSFVVKVPRDSGNIKGVVSALLDASDKACLPCEIIFWGGDVPAWASEMNIPWQHAREVDGLSLKSLRFLESVCQGDYILLAGAEELLMGGLAEGIAILKNSPSVAVCGGRLLSLQGSLCEAGARMNGGRIQPLGQGEAWNAPFFMVSRSVPLVSTNLALFRKKDGLFSSQRHDVLFFNESGGYIGFSGELPLTIVCPNMEAYLLGGEQSKDCQLPPICDTSAIQIASQDRYRAASQLSNGERSLNILYYSPYQSHPASHGNRSTIQFFGKIFREKGCKTHFALLGLDRYTPEDQQAMRDAWDSFTILPYPFQDDSSLGEDIPFDGWYEKGLGEHIAYLCAKFKIDILFCSYVFQSKMLEFVPPHILKVIDTHDKMGGRYEAQKARGLKTEFFSCTPEDEGRYLRRADIVVARRAEEANYFNEVSGRDTAIVIPHVEPPHFIERKYDRLASVGIVASANRINLDLVTDFLLALKSKVADVPFSVRIAGQVSTMLDDVSADKRWIFNEPWVCILGFVDDIKTFYAEVDVVVSPVLLGTGINVKTVQAMAYGMPLVTTACGCKGIETGNPMHSQLSMGGVVDCVLLLHAEPQRLESLADCSKERYDTFYKTSLEEFDTLLSSC